MKTRILDLIVLYSFIWWLLLLFRLEFKFQEQCFLSIRVFFHENSQDIRGREGNIFYSTLPLPSANEHSDIYLHVRWPSHIFNRTACIYQTATRWDLPPYRVTIWLIDNAMLIFDCWLVDLILGFVTTIWHEKPVDTNLHRLSFLHYKRTD